MRALMTLVLAALAVAVAVGSAAKILTLPTTSDVRYVKTDPRTSLNRAVAALAAVGVRDVGTRGAVIERRVEQGQRVELEETWTAGDLGERRNRYLAAGGLLVVALLGAAFVLRPRQFVAA